MSSQPQQFDLGDVIAERTMQLAQPSGHTHDVIVRLGRPVRHPRTPRAWVCPFQIQGLGDEQVVGIVGADTMQALLFSIHTIPVELARQARSAGGALLYAGQPDSSFTDPCRVVLGLVDPSPGAGRE